MGFYFVRRVLFAELCEPRLSLGGVFPLDLFINARETRPSETCKIFLKKSFTNVLVGC